MTPRPTKKVPAPEPPAAPEKLFGFVVLTNGACVIDDVSTMSLQQLGYILEQTNKLQKHLLHAIITR